MAHVYVAIGQDRIVKIGRTINLEARQRSLRTAFRKYGDELVAFHTFDAVSAENADYAERRLVSKLQGVVPQYAGREWFEGGADQIIAAAAVAVQEGIFRRPYDIRPWTAAELEQRRLLAEQAARSLEIWRTKHAAEKVARRELRELRRKEILDREFAKLARYKMASAVDSQPAAL